MIRLFCHGIVPLSLLVSGALLLADAPAAKPIAPRGYVCLKAEKPPVIDGKLDDEAWKAAPWSEDFVDIEGDKKPKPRHRTRMKMLWDDKGLYIAAELEEPHLWGQLKEHDSVIFQDPDFEVFIDPDGDNFNYGELELNALNTTWDLLLTKPYKDGGKALNGWEIIGLKTAVNLNGTLNDPRDTDQSWTVEIFWPWQGLKEISTAPVPPGDGDLWRINFSRVEWDVTVENGKYAKVKGKPEHNWVWSPQGVIDMHRPERWGGLQFSTKTKGPVDLRPDPAQAVKDSLHEVYYAQKDYFKKHGKYATTMDNLGIASDRFPAKATIELTPRGFESLMPFGGKTYGITSESYFWKR
ncbi:carbohydrate-binding family 9-like protein [Zavarzinella formosa]|uniref:carbohydrate-binding family 9-like protein n=1 Tax=Zavarzinella formosa TaxID=360055 RepID=UPI0002E88C45|nr:carbohydrate-binding family 9-like protein [Zavarzinella formosa]